jgi:uncharacterized lipoprotein NlpE involved in copper resistance
VSRGTARWKRKGTVVLGGLLCAALAFGTTTQTWLQVKLPPSAVQTPDLDVPGSDAAVSVTALALVALAGVLAASIAGRIARIIIAVIVMLVGAGITAAALAVIVDPATAASASIGKAIGIIGAPADINVTAFPAVAAVSGVLVFLAAVWLLVAGRTWVRSRRFEGAQTAGSSAASAGRDVDTADGSAASAGQDTVSAGGASPDDDTAPENDGTIDEIDGWDQLSRGQDPTR